MTSGAIVPIRLSVASMLSSADMVESGAKAQKREGAQRQRKATRRESAPRASGGPRIFALPFDLLERHPRIRLQVIRDLGGEDFAEFGALLFAEPGNAFHLLDRFRVMPRHGAQRRIAKDDIRGHAAFVGQLLAQRPE